jgi:hypothetical protein
MFVGRLSLCVVSCTWLLVRMREVLQHWLRRLDPAMQSVCSKILLYSEINRESAKKLPVSF